MNIEKRRETTQRQEMESKTGHMRAEFQNKTGNNKTTNSNYDTGHINLIFVQLYFNSTVYVTHSSVPRVLCLIPRLLTDELIIPFVPGSKGTRLVSGPK